MVDRSSQWWKQFAPSSIPCSRVEKMGGNVITFMSQQLFKKTFVVYFKGFYFMFLNDSSTWQYVISNMHVFFVFYVFLYPTIFIQCVFRTIGSMAFTQLTFGFSLVHYFIHQILHMHIFLHDDERNEKWMMFSTSYPIFCECLHYDFLGFW
jgi:hypothetical protein